MKLESMDELVGKYVDLIRMKDREGGSGWVARVTKISDSGRVIVFDYGMGFFVTEEDSVQEVNPPEGDSGMFVPDAPSSPFR